MLTEYAKYDLSPEALELQLTFLIEELAIGDLEDDMRLVKFSLYEAKQATEEEKDFINRTLDELRTDIRHRKQIHQMHAQELSSLI